MGRCRLGSGKSGIALLILSYVQRVFGHVFFPYM